MKGKILIVLFLLLQSACTKPSQENLYCRLTLRSVLPDGRIAVSISVDPSLAGNQLRNLNTGINYPYPTFVNNIGQVQVQKGVYLLSFDGQALFADGSQARVRFSAWGSPSAAVNVMEDELILEMPLSILP